MARQLTILPTSDMPSSILPPRAEVQNEWSQNPVTHISFHAAQRDNSTISITLFEHFMRADRHTQRAESSFSLRNRKNVAMDQLIGRDWSLPLIPFGGSKLLLENQSGFKKFHPHQRQSNGLHNISPTSAQSPAQASIYPRDESGLHVSPTAELHL